MLGVVHEQVLEHHALDAGVTELCQERPRLLRRARRCPAPVTGDNLVWVVAALGSEARRAVETSSA